MRLLWVLLIALQAGSADPYAGLRQEWAQDLHDKKLDAAVALYAADGTFINPDGSRAQGPVEIRRLFEWATGSFDAELVFHPVRVQQAGDYAFDSGTYTENTVERANGKKHTETGSYLMVYQRQKDGTWKILEQMWTGKE
jgi:ketosteroid isomerase-like protein